MCQSDLSITKEISENPNQRPESMAKVIIFSILNYIYFITNHVFVVRCLILIETVKYFAKKVFLRKMFHIKVIVRY